MLENENGYTSLGKNDAVSKKKASAPKAEHQKNYPQTEAVRFSKACARVAARFEKSREPYLCPQRTVEQTHKCFLSE